MINGYSVLVGKTVDGELQELSRIAFMDETIYVPHGKVVVPKEIKEVMLKLVDPYTNGTYRDTGWLPNKPNHRLVLDAYSYHGYLIDETREQT